MNPTVSVPPNSLVAAYARITSTAGGARDLTLGGNALSIGSGSNCHVRLPAGPALAATLTLENGVVVLHNNTTRQRQALRHGSKLQMGGVAIEILMGGTAPGPARSGAALAAAASPTVPVPNRAPGIAVHARRPNGQQAHHLHGLIAMSFLFLVFSGVYTGLAYLHRSEPWLMARDHAVIRSVSVVYCVYCMATLALLLRNSSRRPATLLAVALAAVAAVSLGVVTCFLGPAVPFGRVFPAWLAVATIFAAAGIAALIRHHKRAAAEPAPG